MKTLWCYVLVAASLCLTSSKAETLQTISKLAPMSVSNSPRTARDASDAGSRKILDFGFNLMKSVNERSKNTVLSPYSVAIAMALVQQGARGETEKELANVLGTSREDSKKLYSQLLRESKVKSNSENILKVATSVFLNKGFEVNPTFKSIATDEFDSEAKSLDFKRPESAAIINKWVSDKTNNLITEITKTEELQTIDAMILLNAIYFKGIWATPFQAPATIDKSFYLSDGTSIQAPMMSMRHRFPYYDPSSNYRIAVLPFKGNEFSMMIILPNDGHSADDVLNSIEPSSLLDYDKYPSTEIDIELPKFKLEYDQNLVPAFQKMSVSRLFTKSAELGELSPKQVYVNLIKHKTFISVDEYGASAAAVTEVDIIAGSVFNPNPPPTPKFTVNKPFVAILLANNNKQVLFTAKVENPNKN